MPPPICCPTSRLSGPSWQSCSRRRPEDHGRDPPASACAHARAAVAAARPPRRRAREPALHDRLVLAARAARARPGRPRGARVGGGGLARRPHALAAARVRAPRDRREQPGPAAAFQSGTFAATSHGHGSARAARPTSPARRPTWPPASRVASRGGQADFPHRRAMRRCSRAVCSTCSRRRRGRGLRRPASSKLEAHGSRRLLERAFGRSAIEVERDWRAHITAAGVGGRVRRRRGYCSRSEGARSSRPR